MKDTNYLIEVRNLLKEFDQPAGDTLRVLAGVSLSVSAGDTVALVGPNGCGKTTLLRIIAGELTPTSGKIYLNGNDVTELPTHERARFMGRVQQDSYKSLASDLTVEEILAMAARRKGALSFRLPRIGNVLDTITALSKSAVDFLVPRRKAVARELSGGQRQLLAVIAAVLGEPRVLLLDEHLSSLDDEFKATANEVIHRFVVKNGAAFIAATHDRSWIAASCGSTATLSEGKITVGVASASPGMTSKGLSS